jgi:hypothetical protein
MNIEGKFKQALEIKSGEKNGKSWEAQAFVIEVQDGNFTKYPMFDTFNKCSELGALKPGQDVNVHFTIDSNEWNGKRFPKVQAFKIETKAFNQPQQAAPTAQPFKQPELPGSENESGLPF